MSKRNKVVKHINLNGPNGLEAKKVLHNWSGVDPYELNELSLVSTGAIEEIKGNDESVLVYGSAKNTLLDPYMALIFFFAAENDLDPKTLDVTRLVVTPEFDEALTQFAAEWYEDNTYAYKAKTQASMAHLTYSPRVATEATNLDDNTVYFVEE